MNRSAPPFQVLYQHRADLAFARTAAVLLVVYGGLKFAARGNPRLDDFPILGILLGVSLVFFGLNTLSELWHHWPYSMWAADRRSVLQMDAAGITLLGESTFAWSEIAEVRSVTVPWRMRGGRVTFLILVLTDVRARFRHPGEPVEQLQRDNDDILRKTAGQGMDLHEHGFLSLAIADTGGASLASHLSATPETIVDQAALRLRHATLQRSADAQASA
jgi:hypothetical protein